MAITLSNITSGFNTALINANFQKVEDYINDILLARAETGVAGEAKMERDLDMDGYRILNADLDTSSITNDRAIRVPAEEGSISPLPAADLRKGKVLTFDVNTGLPIVTAPASGSAVDVLNQLASYADGLGDALVGVKQPLTGSVGRSQHFKNLDIVSVKDFGAVGDGVANDSAAVQAAINAYSSVNYPVRIVFPQGTYNITGITIPRSGIVLDLRGATLSASTGSMFSRIFPQLTQANFIAAYPALDGNQTYFYPITIEGGVVNLSGTATFLEIRQPFLDKYSNWANTLVISDTHIRTYGTSKAFAIHGGWGFEFNSITVTGDVNTSTGFGGSVGSGTCLYCRPDNTLNGSSHPQLLCFNNCIISYCKVFDMDRGTVGGSAEALYLNNSNCMFVEGGTIDRVNLVEFNKGMFVTTAKELYFNGCAGVLIDGMQVQRYNNPRVDSRYGQFQFIGGGSEIKISNCRAVAGPDLTGTMFGFRANAGEEFLDVQISNIQYVSSITNVNETDQSITSSVVRGITVSTGKITGITINNVSARQVHNIIDFGDNGTTGSINRLELRAIRNVGSSVKTRVRGLNANISNIKAPELYAVNFIRMRGASVGATATVCMYENFKTLISGATLPVATITNNTPVSNAVSISFSSWDNEGNVILALNQVAGLSAGTPVECTATLTLNTSEAILA